MEANWRTRLAAWRIGERERWRGGLYARLARALLRQAASPACPFCGYYVGVSITDRWRAADGNVGVTYFCARIACGHTFVGTASVAALNRREQLIGGRVYLDMLAAAEPR